MKIISIKGTKRDIGVILGLILLMSFMLHSCELKPAKADETLIGYASWYSKNDPTDPFVHKYNADGSKFNENNFTCAMRSRDFGKRYQITNLSNGRSVVVIHKDYGPALKYKSRDLSNRICDLSKVAFKEIADLKTGVIKVKIEEAK